MKGLSRNEKDLKQQLVDLCDVYVQKFEGSDEVYSLDDRIEMIANYIEKGEDKDNPKAFEFYMHPQMSGTLDNKIESYHIMDNPKYVNSKKIIDTIKEAYKIKIEKEDEYHPNIEDTVD